MTSPCKNTEYQPLNHDHPMKKTEIAFILDRSGSMQSMCSFNEEEAATLRESMAETLDKSRKEKK